MCDGSVVLNIYYITHTEQPLLVVEERAYHKLALKLELVLGGTVLPYGSPSLINRKGLRDSPFVCVEVTSMRKLNMPIADTGLSKENYPTLIL